jgi:hypothetical protein
MITSAFPFVSSSTSALTVPDENLITSLSRFDKFTRTISPVSLNFGILKIRTFCPPSPSISHICQYPYLQQAEKRILVDSLQRKYEVFPPIQMDLDPETDNTLN